MYMIFAWVIKISDVCWCFLISRLITFRKNLARFATTTNFFKNMRMCQINWSNLLLHLTTGMSINTLYSEAVAWRCSSCNIIKKRLQCRCFPVKFAKFVRTLFFIEHLRWLLFSFTLEEVITNHKFFKLYI